MNDSGESKGGKHQGLLESVRSSMEKEFRSNRSIEEYFNDGKNLTGHQCISYSHFRTLFKQRFQLSPGQFLEQLRWSEAKKLLHLGQKSIKEIAAELGFENPYYFSRFFKKHQGVSPKHFFGWKSNVLNALSWYWNRKGCPGSSFLLKVSGGSKVEEIRKRASGLCLSARTGEIYKAKTIQRAAK